jgi:hypothetical protein
MAPSKWLFARTRGYVNTKQYFISQFRQKIESVCPYQHVTLDSGA